MDVCVFFFCVQIASIPDGRWRPVANKFATGEKLLLYRLAHGSSGGGGSCHQTIVRIRRQMVLLLLLQVQP